MATEDKRIDQLDPVSVLDLTSLMAMQQGTNAKKVTLQQLLDYLNGQIDTGNAVLFVSQTLTESEKRTARKNIRAAGEGDIPYGVVHYLSDQSLTDAQKLQARTNIGAAAPGEGGGSVEGAVLYTAQTLTESQQHQARKNIRCGSVGEVGDDCVAKGQYSHAEGRETSANDNFAHAEGLGTSANFAGHAEGAYTFCDSYGHAEGERTRASRHAHAQGYFTEARGYYSHSEGDQTVANGEAQHVQGRRNIEDNDNRYAHIVGNGSFTIVEGPDGEQIPFEDYSNAHTLDWAGVPWFAGDRVMLGGTGMDDEAAVALMPVFVPQELTEEQKAQARANIGVDAYIEQVFLGGEW